MRIYILETKHTFDVVSHRRVGLCGIVLLGVKMISEGLDVGS